MKQTDPMFRRYMAMHQNPVNRVLHVVAMVATYACMIGALWRVSWAPLALIPAFYGLAISGHFLFERNEPAFARHVREHGWKDARGLVKLFIVEEWCVFLMSLEVLGLRRQPRHSDE